MDTNQPAGQPAYPASATPGFFGTKIPSSVAFVVGVLLFLLPFSEIKCGGSTLANKSGLDFAMGKEWKSAGTANMFGKSDLKEKSESAGKEEKGNSQYFAIAALALGVLGLLLSFANAKTGGGGGLVAGILSAGALIALMLDLKKNFNDSLRSQALDKTQEGAGSLGLDKISDSMNNIKPTLSFTPWFYIAVIAFLAAAFFCYKRMSSVKR